MKLLKTTLASLALAAATTASGQFRTETVQLQGGWSAFYLPVDTGEMLIDDLLAAHPSIVELWQWRPEQLDERILDDPENPVVNPEWQVWRRGDPANTTLAMLSPNAAYLAKVDGAALSLNLRGRVVPPQVRWRTDGLNLVGFQTPAGAAPNAEDFFAPGQVLDSAAEVYGYLGGELLTDFNPSPLVTRFATVERNRAFWVRTSKYLDYYGPLNVRVVLGDGIDFGASRNEVRLVLTNRADHPITATLTPVDSEVDPETGAAQTPVPLVFEAPGQSIDLAAGESIGVTVRIDRAALTGAPGDALNSLLRVTDGGGLSEIYLPVTAEVGSNAGLWVGEALVTHVQNQLQEFEQNEDGSYKVDLEDPDSDTFGRHVPVLDGGDTGLNKTAQSFRLRLIVHVDGAGNARLLDRAYLGAVRLDADGLPVFGIAREEGALLPAHLGEAGRISAAHLPPGTDLALLGAGLAPGGNLTGTLLLGHDDPANPFLHGYHPDHDNLDARFEDPLPEGIESHRIDRAITLSFDAAAPDGVGSEWGTTALTGAYAETVSGLHKNPIATAGAFALRRVSDVPEITTAP